ncbi:MAG TPA: pilus assembly protein [Bryobacteraceae bacterium]|nr:pilus assembly protein [Bryobacteraceae bacterium]HOL71319.1 pilus assembly protein [Bryobacteraceae bacterium]HOQ45369.1 pilus assembly protein [Bryobacteraceae bacterium]HPQ17035.1 pilus assembly protein [Bryobacteraceae bacterium]HPU71320.1 pilus assembly protein [Bryobacteraceae bacterium]
MTRRNSGAAVVEASLILMLYLAFVFSIFDFGFVTFSFHTIQERAAEAVRYGVVRPISITAGCVTGSAASGTEAEMVNILMYGAPNASGGSTGLLGLTKDKIQICRDYAPFAEERLRLRITGFRYPLINYFIPGWHTARTFTASLPMEYAPPPSP